MFTDQTVSSRALQSISALALSGQATAGAVPALLGSDAMRAAEMADPFGFLVATWQPRPGQAVADYWKDGWCAGVVTGLKQREEDESEVDSDGESVGERWVTVKYTDGEEEDMYEDHGQPNALQVLSIISCTRLSHGLTGPAQSEERCVSRVKAWQLQIITDGLCRQSSSTRTCSFRCR